MNSSAEQRTAFKETNSHKYYTPHPLLRNYISHYTIQFFAQGNAACLTLLPDVSGSIVFERNQRDLNIYLWGPTTKIFQVKNEISNQDPLLFIEFLPGGISGFLKNEIFELANIVFYLKDIDKGLYQQLYQAFESSDSYPEIIDKIDNILLAVLLMQGQDLFFQNLSSLVSRQGLYLRNVKEISEMCHYSTRHINRIFHKYAGTSLNRYLKINKINHLLKELGSKAADMKELTYNFQYFDQSHMIHDFKSVCGVTPTQYLRRMSDFYNEEFKF